MLTSSRLAPPRTCSIATSTASPKSPASISRRNFAEPVTFVRSPAMTKPVSGPTTNGSSPANRGRVERSGTRRGRSPSTARAICAVCSGVVPQQPPTRFTSPSSANPRRKRLVSPGCSSWSPSAFGSPAFGWQETYVDAVLARLSRNGRMSVAPSEQFTPTMNGSACSTEIQKASEVCPERLRPLRSTAVNESQSGISGATSRAATIAALAFSVSKIVSIEQQVDAAVAQRRDLLLVRRSHLCRR